MSTPSSFSGTWFTSFGRLKLEPRGAGWVGTYRYGTSDGELTGRLEGGELRFRYRDAFDSGTGSFHQVRSGRFIGHYRVKGSRHLRRWDGESYADSVRRLQEMLNVFVGRAEEGGHAHPIAVDGEFGRQTEQAVRTFQGADAGDLAVDGIVGPKICTKLFI